MKIKCKLTDGTTFAVLGPFKGTDNRWISVVNAFRNEHHITDNWAVEEIILDDDDTTIRYNDKILGTIEYEMENK